MLYIILLKVSVNASINLIVYWSPIIFTGIYCLQFKLLHCQIKCKPLPFRCVFVPEGKAVVDADLLAKDLAINVRQRDVWGTYRHLPLDQLASRPSTHALLNVATRGDLASLTWFQMASQVTSYGHEDNMLGCDVHYAPLNFRDVMLATGKLPPDALPGDLAMKV